MASRKSPNQTMSGLKSNLDAIGEFVTSLDTKERKSSTSIQPFAQTAVFIMTYLPTFTVNDFINLTKGKEIPAAECKRLFSLFTDHMIKLHRLKKVESAVYDDTVYSTLG